MKRLICCNLMILVMFAAGYQSSDLGAAELRPFLLPGTGAPGQAEKSPSQFGGVAETPAVYEKFEADVRRMNLQEKRDTRQYYEKLREQAAKNGDRPRINYYGNLINIINKHL